MITSLINDAGIVTVGPNIAVYASADAAVTVAGQLQAAVTIASWEIQQVYPQTANYPVDPLDQPDYDGTQTIGNPSFDASVTATGEVVLHLKPEITFGIVFDSRWSVDPCSVSLVLDGYIIFHAEASLSTSGDNSCPFTYGIDAGTNLYAQLSSPPLFGWGGQQQIPIASVPRKQITPEVCPTQGSSSRLVRSVNPGYYSANESAMSLDRDSGANSEFSNLVSPIGAAYVPGLLGKRDTFSLGPLITIPSSFLSCPADAAEEDNGCPLCSSTSTSFKLKARQDGDGSEPTGPTEMACPWCPEPEDDACSDSTISKRAQGTKPMTLSWAGKFPYSYYPSCSTNDLAAVNPIPKVWRLFESA